MARLALGTAAFGMAYGVARKSEAAVPLDEVRKILTLAREAKLDTLDTAMSYGASEETLGKVGLDGWRVVTKIGCVPNGTNDPSAWVESQVRGSLDRLGVEQLHGLLLHDVSQLVGREGPEVARALLRLVDIGLVAKVGVSIYGPEPLERICEILKPDLVQLPFNALDRRIEVSGWADRLMRLGAEVHVRSVFLQGLLLIPPEARPAIFDWWAPIWQAWAEWQNHTDLSARELCLALALSRPWVHSVLVGVEDANQLAQLISVPLVVPEDPPAVLAQGVTDTSLVDPFNWNTL